MPETIILNTLTPPAGTCIPGNAAALIALVNQYTQAVFNQDFALFNYGSNTPDPENQDRPWYRLMTNGQALGWYYYYNGKWTRDGGSLQVGDMIMMTGAGESSTNFDSSGKGIAGTPGEGWLIANGNNGTPDMRNRFPAAGSNYSSGQWITSIDPNNPNTATGGQSSTLLGTGEIPRITKSLPRGSGIGGNGGFVWGYDTALPDYTLTIGQLPEDQNRQPIINPYRAVGMKIWNPFA